MSNIETIIGKVAAYNGLKFMAFARADGKHGVTIEAYNSYGKLSYVILAADGVELMNDKKFRVYYTLNIGIDEFVSMFVAEEEYERVQAILNKKLAEFRIKFHADIKAKKEAERDEFMRRVSIAISEKYENAKIICEHYDENNITGKILRNIVMAGIRMPTGYRERSGVNRRKLKDTCFEYWKLAESACRKRKALSYIEDNPEQYCATTRSIKQRLGIISKITSAMDRMIKNELSGLIIKIKDNDRRDTPG